MLAPTEVPRLASSPRDDLSAAASRQRGLHLTSRQQVSVLRLLLAPDGPVNGLLRMAAASPVPWLRDSAIALVVLIVVQVLKTLGYSMVLFLAALQTVPPDLVDAARVDGAGRWRSFRAITLP